MGKEEANQIIQNIKKVLDARPKGSVMQPNEAGQIPNSTVKNLAQIFTLGLKSNTNSLHEILVLYFHFYQ